MDKILIFDLGGQYCHLIARRIRDLGVHAEIVPSDFSARDAAKDKNIKGIILSGGARSVYERNAPRFDRNILRLPVPILGICYGHQLIAHALGGKVIAGRAGEYGLTKLKVRKNTGIFSGIGKNETAWMNHRDIVARLPDSFVSLGATSKSANAAFMNRGGTIFGVQFHPEVTHTKSGGRILRNFIIGVCKAKKTRNPKALVRDIVNEAKFAIGTKNAVIGLSGGVDSSVAAAIMTRAIGKKLTAVYVDTGLMRHDDRAHLERFFKGKANLKIINAGERFFRALKGITEPERKRKIIGKLFANIFSEVAKREKAEFLVQGTIYSDRIESGITKHSSKIKSHHNVGGLPKNLKLKVYEPLRDFYKDEVRRIGASLGMPDAMVRRQVFPGPGLAIRIIGGVTHEKAEIVRAASRIIEEELRKTKFWKDIWMGFAVLLSVRSVGIQGDARSYKYPVVVRIIESRDAMTANFSKIPFEILEKISTRITNEIKEVNRVVYDISNKPPATMEWE